MTGYKYADGQSTDQFGIIYPSGAVGGRLDSLGRMRQGTTTKPGVALGAGAGTGPAGLTLTGTDSHGNITFTSGTTPTAASTVATVTFAQPYTGTNPPIVQIEGKDAGGAIALYYANCTNTVLTIKTAGATALPASTAVSFDYFVVGGA